MEIILKVSPFVSWGNVELYRALHDELPGDKEMCYVAALHAASDKVMKGKVSPYNAGTMLAAAAEKIRELQTLNPSGK